MNRKLSEPRLFDSNSMEWRPHPQFPDIRFKALETRATHPVARFSLVELKVGGVIETHMHEAESETVYFLAGRGILTANDKETFLEAGMGITIPPKLPHRLHNTGDIPIEVLAVHTADESIENG